MLFPIHIYKRDFTVICYALSPYSWRVDLKSPLSTSRKIQTLFKHHTQLLLVSLSFFQFYIELYASRKVFFPSVLYKYKYTVCNIILFYPCFFPLVFLVVGSYNSFSMRPSRFLLSSSYHFLYIPNYFVLFFAAILFLQYYLFLCANHLLSL